MDDDELIAAMASGDDTALRELFARHALVGGHEPVHWPDAAAVRSRLRGRGEASRLRRLGPGETGRPLARLYLTSRRVPMAMTLLAMLGALLWAVLHWHWHWNIAGLVIAAGVALITVLGPRESGRESGPAS